MSLADLKSKYNVFQRMSFPEAGQSDFLAEWIFELIEVCAYYSQFAHSIIQTQDFSLTAKIDFSRIKNMKQRLEQINEVPSEDQAHLAYCKMHFAALEKVVEAMEAGP